MLRLRLNPASFGGTPPHDVDTDNRSAPAPSDSAPNDSAPDDSASDDTASRDASLVAAYRAGDDRAFDLLATRYQRRATSVAYRLLGNSDDALDVAQEALIRAFQRIESLDDPRRFGPWLLRIVTNLALNQRRSRGSRGVVLSIDATGDEQDGETGAMQLEDRAPNSDGLDEREVDQRVREEIAALSEQQQTALVLFSLESLPQRDVAEIMDCSVEAVKWHVFQARKRLRERLADVLEA